MADQILDFHHRGSLGDIIYALPTVMSYGTKSVLYLKPDHLKAIGSLLRCQPYVVGVKEKQALGKSYINLDAYRSVSNVKPSLHLVLCHFEAMGKSDGECPINWRSEPWLFNIDALCDGDIIINRTTRYHDKEELDWMALEPYKDRCRFVGWRGEWRVFTKRFFHVDRCSISDCLHLARVIKGSRMFVGNQSCSFAIAEALKHPRFLEVYHAKCNCIPQSGNGMTKLSSELIEQYLK